MVFQYFNQQAGFNIITTGSKLGRSLVATIILQETSFLLFQQVGAALLPGWVQPVRLCILEAIVHLTSFGKVLAPSWVLIIQRYGVT